MGSKRQTILGGSAGIAVFLAAVFIMEFPLPVGVILALGTYFGVYFLTKPTYKLGSIDLDSLANGQEVKELLAKAASDLKRLEAFGKQAKHREIGLNAGKLYDTGLSMITYLQKNPEKVLTARRFLTYYLDTAADIMEKYAQFSATNFAAQEMEQIYAKTNQALAVLNQAFAKQFLKLMQNEFFDIEADINVLEKTLKMEE